MRSRLALLILAVLTPGLVFGGVLFSRFAEAERRRHQEAALELAQRVASDIDRELTGLVAAVEALATSPALDSGNFEAFDRQARAVLRSRGSFIAMRDATGQQFINTSRPFGSPLPVSNDPAVRAADAKVFSTGRIVVSDLYVGAATRLHLILVDGPVRRGDSIAFALNIALSPTRLAAMAAAAAPPDWTVAVIDSKNLIVARSREHERFLGTLANESIRNHARGDHGVWTGTTLEGIEVLSAHASSSIAPWRVAVGVPVSVMSAPLQSAALTIVLASLVVLAVSLLLALLAARSIATPLAELAAAAGRLGQGERLTETRSGLKEADAIAAALARAGTELAERQADLSRAQRIAGLGRLKLDLRAGRRPAVLSPEYAALHGLPPETTLEPHEQWIARVHPDDRAQAEAQFLEAVAGSETRYEAEYRIIRPSDGVLRWIFADNEIERDDAGRPVRLIGVHRDVTEAHERDELLRQEVERVQLALDAGAIIGTWNWELPIDRFRADARFARSFGLEPERCREGLPIEAVVATVHPDDKPGLMRAIAEAIGRGGPYAHQYRVRRQDGQYYWIEANGRVELAPDRTPLRFPGVLLDIESRRAAEAERDRANALLAAVVDAVPGVVYAKDLHGRFLVANQGTAELIGRQAADFLGRTDADVLHDRAQAETIMANDRRVMESGVSEQIEEEVSFPDGRRAVWLSIKAPFRNGSGEVIGLVGSSFDITARKDAEERLKVLNETLEQRVAEALAGRRLWADVIEATDAFILVVDMDARVLAINRANADEFERRYGVRPTIGDHLPSLLDGFADERDRIAEFWRRPLAGESYSLTTEFGEADGGRRWYDIKFSPLDDAEGRRIGAVQFGYDVTERELRRIELEAAQAKLFEAQKMETLGQLTGGVAHDFNNLLAALSSNLEILGKRIRGDARSERLLAGAMQATERGASLTRRLLAFARRQDLKAETVRLPALFKGMHDLLTRSLGPEVRIEADLPASLPPVVADANQLELALLNLAVNARDAMPSGGVLRIEASAERIARGEERHGLAPGAYVRLAVTDTGVGMDAETLQRAAEPFFTTKGVGKGTGLGLSMVHGLAAQSGGALALSSTIGVGTRAELWLPSGDVPAKGAPRRSEPESAPEPGGDRLVVLAVDDDPLVLMGTVDMLEDLGHEAISAASGPDALAVLAGRGDVRLVLTDHAMPGMNGAELAARIRAERPDLPIIVATGYVEAIGDEHIGWLRLTKPFRQGELATALAKALAAPPPPATMAG